MNTERVLVSLNSIVGAENRRASTLKNAIRNRLSVLLVLTVCTPFALFSNHSLAKNTTSNATTALETTIDKAALPASKSKETSTRLSLSASIQQYNLREPDQKETTWVSLSPFGMRTRSASGEAEIVKNFLQRRVWLLNLKRRIQHEIDVPAFEQRFPEFAHLLLGSETRSNVLGESACTDFIAEYVGVRDWRGQAVEEWLCKNDDGTVNSNQYFSQRWQFVVRVAFPDLTVEEAVNIKEKHFSPGDFQQTADMESVGLDYFFEGKKQLDKFSQ